MTVGEGREPVIGVSDRPLHPTASMRPHTKPRSPPRVANKSSSSKPDFFLARRFLDFAPPTLATPQPERSSDLVRIADASTCRGWSKRKCFAGGERVDRAIVVLSTYRSPTVTVFYTAETLQDELLTIKHYCVRRSPQYAAAVQCSQISDSASQTNRRGMSNDTPFSLGTTGASSFDRHHSSLSMSPLRLFTREFRILPSAKSPKLMTFLSFQPSRGEVLTNPKVVNSLTDAWIYQSIPRLIADWYGKSASPAHMSP
ncbi:hypothetical protein ARMGADRAFT_1087738 [Armillaria gallica]|uniref:Uncharacterized protein n=1 Tax=Armillaria gallica TaxID=47427 RepID=A0A2H3CUC5_ARMGA|nr:hypothetical protein ARMGADRAFT_1087738 [Armillaria gallica]